jgi:hypothetical protein
VTVGSRLPIARADGCSEDLSDDLRARLQAELLFDPNIGTSMSEAHTYWGIVAFAMILDRLASSQATRCGIGSM